MRTPGVLSRRPVRLRLALLYSGLFLLAGAALLAVTYVLVADTLGSNLPQNQIASITQTSGSVDQVQGEGDHAGAGRALQAGSDRGRAGHRRRRRRETSATRRSATCSTSRSPGWS